MKDETAMSVSNINFNSKFNLFTSDLNHFLFSVSKTEQLASYLEFDMVHYQGKKLKIILH